MNGHLGKRLLFAALLSGSAFIIAPTATTAVVNDPKPVRIEIEDPIKAEFPEGRKKLKDKCKLGPRPIQPPPPPKIKPRVKQGSETPPSANAFHYQTTIDPADPYTLLADFVLHVDGDEILDITEPGPGQSIGPDVGSETSTLVTLDSGVAHFDLSKLDGAAVQGWSGAVQILGSSGAGLFAVDGSGTLYSSSVTSAVLERNGPAMGLAVMSGDLLDSASNSIGQFTVSWTAGADLSLLHAELDVTPSADISSMWLVLEALPGGGESWTESTQMVQAADGSTHAAVAIAHAPTGKGMRVVAPTIGGQSPVTWGQVGPNLVAVELGSGSAAFSTSLSVEVHASSPEMTLHQFGRSETNPMITTVIWE